MTSIDTPDISMFTYGASGIQTRSDDGRTETFNYDNGRISQTETMSFRNTITDYTYDNEGKLIGVIGDAFDADDDCELIFIGDVSTETDNDQPAVEPPADNRSVFEIAYTGDRLDSITASTGGMISFEYNQQGLPVRETRSGECASFGSTVTEYTYRADGRILTESTRSTDSEPETEELIATYTGDQLTQMVTTIRSENLGDETTTTNYNYDAGGRLSSGTIVVESVFDGIADIDTITLTYNYEEESCVEQLTAYPDTAALANVFNAGDLIFLNLGCAFPLDDF